MRASVLILGLAVLSACGRPLSDSEADLASRLFGDGLQIEQVRLGSSSVIGLRTSHFRARPQTTCRERIVPPPETEWLTGRTAGVTLWNHVTVRDDLMRDDFVQLPDGSMPLGLAMFFAHEVTHVWQWQNRDVTGYSPLRVGLEHQQGADPYLFETDTNLRFLDYGYEQQASLVEEYVCCVTLDPEGARTGRLYSLISQVMEPRDLPDWPVRIPWEDAPIRGICG